VGDSCVSISSVFCWKIDDKVAVTCHYDGLIGVC